MPPSSVVVEDAEDVISTPNPKGTGGMPFRRPRGTGREGGAFDAR